MRSGLAFREPPPDTHLENCTRCGHRFDTLAAGHAGVSIVCGPGHLGDYYRRVILCPGCRDELRLWLAR